MIPLYMNILNYLFGNFTLYLTQVHIKVWLDENEEIETHGNSDNEIKVSTKITFIHEWETSKLKCRLRTE